MKYLYNLFIALFLGLPLLLSCTEKEATVEVSSVSLNTATIEMVEGETFNLVVTVLPKDAEYDGITWASSNASVASVNSGTVTALKEGTATITASAGGKSSTCSVKVSSKVIPVTSVTLDKTTLSLAVGESAQLTATVTPADATDKNVIWTSSDESVAKVADGKVTAVKAGKVTITAKCGDKTAECMLTVTIPVKSISLDKTTLSLAVGESAQLTAAVNPVDATDRNVTWTSSDKSVVLVSNGIVKAIKVGFAVVTASVGNKSVSCEITVIYPDNIIYYTADNGGEPVAPNNEDVFGANLISNEYSDGIGRLVFDGPVTKIGDKAFVDCVKITSMQIPESVTTIGTYAFYSCKKLKSINTPKKLTSIGSYAFYACRSLLYYTLPNIERIEDSTFEECNQLVIDNFPSSVKLIGSEAFRRTGIEELILPDGVETIEERAFYQCTSLVKLTISSSVSKIESYAFDHCSALTDVIIQEGVKTIEFMAFADCTQIKSVTLPGTLEKLGTCVFDKCSYLSDLYIKTINPPAKDNLWLVRDDWLGLPYSGGPYVDLSIWVPSSSVDVYKTTVGWSKYKDNIKGYDY